MITSHPSGSVTVRWRRLPRRRRRIAIAIELLTGVPAMPSGIALIRDGMGMPTEWIDHSLLPDFTIPGILLLVLIGGGMTASALVSPRHPDLAGPLAFAMGLLLIAWLCIETLIVGWHGGPQVVLDAVYAGFGVTLAVIGAHSLEMRHS